MDILIMGGPDTGKGMMSAKVVKKFNVSHTSMGDIFRNEIGEGAAPSVEAKSFVNGGLLVPDEVINNMVKSYLEKLEDKKNGFLLGNYPRILDQAKAPDILAEGNELAINRVIILEIDFRKLADRVAGRRICEECGGIYHIKSKPGRTDNVCDVCGGELFQHEDDTVESLTMRLEEYNLQTAPVFDYYDSKGIVTRIGASQPVDSVWSGTLTALERWEWWKSKQIRS